MSFNPWYKTTLKLQTETGELKFKVPHDVFSTKQIDEGTLLLLANLPQNTPSHVLDMGCGYGALGLPVASRLSKSEVTMVDRDLLAVFSTSENATLNNCPDIKAKGSLGFSNITGKYDWILCNVPARIGRPFIEDLFITGNGFLKENGETRIVVINDLVPLIEEIKKESGLKIEKSATGRNHTVFSLSRHDHADKPGTGNLYFRDKIHFGGLEFDRPFDLGGDDPRRLKYGLPILVDALPKNVHKRILCFRSGYGILPILCCKRWPEAHTVVIERDLLALDFIEKNMTAHNIPALQHDLRGSHHFPLALMEDEKFDLIIGELSPSGGALVAKTELLTIAKRLDKGGVGLVLIHEKLEKEWIVPILKETRLHIIRMIARDGYALLRITP